MTKPARGLFFAALFLMVGVCRPTFSQEEIGYIESIKGEVFWKPKPEASEVKLKPKKVVGQKLVPNESFRCGHKGSLVLQLYGKRVPLTEEMGEFRIPYPVPKGRDQKKNTEKKSGTTGGSTSRNDNVTQGLSETSAGIFAKSTRHRYSFIYRYGAVEYPLNREVTIDFKPVEQFSSYAVEPVRIGNAKVFRRATGSTIKFNFSEKQPIPGYLYVVDETGATTMLTTVKAGEFEMKVPFTRFGLFGSMEPNLTTFRPGSHTFYFSAPREKLAVFPLLYEEPLSTFGETAMAQNPYHAPMINVAKLKPGEELELQLVLRVGLTETKERIVIKRLDAGASITVNFQEVKGRPANKVYALWTVSPDDRFVLLGRIGGPDSTHTEITAQTDLKDFGLLLTLEPEAQTSLSEPTGPVIGVAERLK